MVQLARIKLTSSNLEKLQGVCTEIKGITEKTGVKVRGPLPLPTKKLRITTRKAPSGQGTHTFDHWQMRIHRRLIDLDADDRTMRQLLKLKVPEDVFIEVNLSH
ncbi:MAG: 30S ribosomal protein S10 [Thaumarchaeota archaeon]|nr:30S ribosomal protein S10 [Nitrososphaerota archaeon]